MAKKMTKCATETKKPAPAKKTTGAKAAKKKAAPAKTEPIEIELEEVEATAIELVHSSSKVCDELEKAVTSAVSQAVRKVYKQNKVSLTTEQAEKVALLLFGD
jgi:hypothetical protein